LGTLEMEADLLLKKFKNKNRLAVLARIAFTATVWHKWRERNERIFKNNTRHKIIVFRSIYADIKELMTSCQWKPKDDTESKRILSYWNV